MNNFQKHIQIALIWKCISYSYVNIFLSIYGLKKVINKHSNGAIVGNGNNALHILSATFTI